MSLLHNILEMSSLNVEPMV